MGTSSGHGGGTGGAWTGYKRAATAFARHGGRDRAASALANHVGALGGVGAAVSSAGAGVRTGQSLAKFLVASTGTAGFAAGLEAVGLAPLVGLERFEVLSALVDLFAGSGADLESQAARSALLDVLDDLLPEEGVSLDAERLDEAAVIEALEKFLAALVYNRAIPVIDERLTRLRDPELARRRDQELREYIKALVKLRLAELQTIDVDWDGPQGRQTIEGLLAAVYELLEHEGG